MTAAAILAFLYKASVVLVPPLLLYLRRQLVKSDGWKEILDLAEDAWTHVEVWKIAKRADGGQAPSREQALAEFLDELERWRTVRKLPKLSHRQLAALKEWARLKSSGAKLPRLANAVAASTANVTNK